MKRIKKLQKTLAKQLASIKDEKLMHAFLEDLLTKKEFEEMAKRLELVKMLEAGIPQRTIAEKLQMGIATVTRGSKELQNPKGGFKKVLQTT